MRLISLKLAWRELSGGVKGFGIYLACLALGVFAIAASGSVTLSFTNGLEREARTLLGGDAAFTAVQRRASVDERAWMETQGIVSEIIALNVMGESNTRRRQVDLRVVDDLHPLVGVDELSGSDTGLAEALAYEDGRWGVIVSASLLEQFTVEIGDEITLGPVTATIMAQIDKQSDGLGTPGSFGPFAMMQIEPLEAAGRLTNGQLFRSTYRLILKPGAEADEVGDAAEEAWGAGGLDFRTPEDAVDGLRGLLDMLNSFLAVIGIAALVAGGVGVAQATSSFLDSRLESIAALKALGADSGLLRTAYLVQLGVLAALGAMIGVAFGAIAPFILNVLAGDRIPLPQIPALYLAPLLQAFTLGMLAAAVFALPALGRARATSPARLFRQVSETDKDKSPWLERGLAALAGVLLVAMAVLTSPRPGMTFMLLASAGVAWLILIGAAYLIRFGARLSARNASGTRRLMLSNLGGPGSLAPTIAPALGLGLALLTLVVTVQANLLRQVRETAPANVPSLVMSQIPNQQIEAFDALLSEQGVAIENSEDYRRFPFILGRVTSLKGVTLDVETVEESERWVVDGEVGMTYLGQIPPETILAEGEWWDADYTGPLLVSVEIGAARGLHLGIGDTIGFRVFGREVEATVTSLREVDWGGFGANTAFILSPGTLEAANPMHLAFVQTEPEFELPIIDAIGKDYPGVVVFQTRGLLETAGRLLGDISIAVNAAASIVTIAGLLVLLGAFAAMARRRESEAALLKTFGATKSTVLSLYAGEFGLAAAAAALLGGGMGVAAAYPIVVNVFEAEWSFPWTAILTVSGLAIFAAAAGGAMVGLATLSRPPARVLRAV